MKEQKNMKQFWRRCSTKCDCKDIAKIGFGQLLLLTLDVIEFFSSVLKGDDAFYISSSYNSQAAKKETSCLGARTEEDTAFKK